MDKTIINCNPRTSKLNRGGTGILTSKEHCFCLQTTPHLVSNTSQCSQESEDLKKVLNNQEDSNVSDSAKLTNTQISCWQPNGQTSKTMGTPGLVKFGTWNHLIYWLEDFLASHSQSLVNGEVSKIPEA